MPAPSSAAQPRAPTVNGIIDGHISSSANGTTRRGQRRDARAADPVGEDAAERPHQRREDDEARRAETGIRHRQAEIVAQQCRQVDGKGDESTEREEIESGKRPRERSLVRTADHRGDPSGPDRDRRVAGKK